MFKWIEKLLNKEFKSVELPEIKNPLPTPTAVKNVSEPVLSFVEEFKRRPQTFRFKMDDFDLRTKASLSNLNRYYASSVAVIHLLDKVTGEKWHFSCWLKESCYPQLDTLRGPEKALWLTREVKDVMNLPQWMNLYEIRYVRHVLMSVYLKRLSKIQKRVDRENRKRQDRLNNEQDVYNRNERARLTAIYAGENHG